MISVKSDFAHLLDRVQAAMDYLLSLNSSSEDAKATQLMLLTEGLLYIRFFSHVEAGKVSDHRVIARTIQSAKAFCTSVTPEMNNEE